MIVFLPYANSKLRWRLWCNSLESSTQEKHITHKALSFKFWFCLWPQQPRLFRHLTCTQYIENEIKQNGIVALGEALESNQTLTELRLSGNSSQVFFVHYFCFWSDCSPQNSKHCKSDWCKSIKQRFNDKHVPNLSQHFWFINQMFMKMEQNHKFLYVVLYRKFNGTCRGKSNQWSIKSQHNSSNTWNRKFGFRFSYLLRVHSSDVLWFIENNIGDLGATSLSEALKVNTSITVLSLRCLCSFLSWLMTFFFISEEWSGNKIGNDGVNALSAALGMNTSLAELDISCKIEYSLLKTVSCVLYPPS